MPYKNKEDNRAYDTAYHKKLKARDPVYKERQRLIVRKWRKDNPVKKHLIAAKSRAKKKGLEFNLDEKDLSIPSHCPILGIPLVSSEDKQTKNSPALDRRDNSKGYTKDNAAFISHKANMMKADITIEQVEKLLAYMKGEI